MRYTCLMLAAWVCAAVAGVAGGDPVNPTATASHVGVVVGKRASDVEQRVADVLAKRIAFRADVACSVVPEQEAGAAQADLLIYLGMPATHDALAALCLKHGVATPTVRDPGPEGFAVRTAREGDRAIILAAGVDKRGVVYSAGEILRQVTCNDGSIAVPEINVRTAPAYRWRGFSPRDEVTMLNLAFAGGNLCGGGKAFDLMDGAGFRPNEWVSKKPYPKEWQSPTEREVGWVCPSVPAARKALLAQWDEVFKKHADADVVRFFAGDPGGCRCPKCSPWGKTFVHLCEDMAKIWLKYHPHSSIQIANQDLDNAGDIAIFDYLNEKPRKWLYAICYGPGSNAMSRYFRNELRDDLFTYPGAGPVNRYLRETLNNIPKYQKIVFYTDITHWISSQNQLPHPEAHLVAVYGRRTFHVRPRQLYSIFQATMSFSEGDLPYSEGTFDELNQYLWERLLWNPNRPLEDILVEYCRMNFGAAAAPEMMEAIFQLEQNLQTPLAGNDGTDRYYTLVKSAGWKIPAQIMRHDFRWRLYMQKAALDKYVQLWLRRQMDLRDRTTQVVGRALAAGDADAATAAAAILDEAPETPEMAGLHAEAERLAKEMADLDPRVGAHFILLPETPDDLKLQDWERYKYRLNLDFVGLGWMRGQMERAKPAQGAERLRLLQEMVSYQDPGPGGFYDDLGGLEGSSHLVHGETVNGSRWLDPENRPSANTLAYTFGRGKGKGVTLRYDGLDPQAQYKVRLTMVAPRLPAAMMPPGQVRRAQSIVANGHYLARDVEIPLYTARQFEYDIPQEVTRDGALDLWLESGNEGGATVASEVWLIKK